MSHQGFAQETEPKATAEVDCNVLETSELNSDSFRQLVDLEYNSTKRKSPAKFMTLLSEYFEVMTPKGVKEETNLMVRSDASTSGSLMAKMGVMNEEDLSKLSEEKFFAIYQYYAQTTPSSVVQQWMKLVKSPDLWWNTLWSATQGESNAIFDAFLIHEYTMRTRLSSSMGDFGNKYWTNNTRLYSGSGDGNTISVAHFPGSPILISQTQSPVGGRFGTSITPVAMTNPVRNAAILEVTANTEFSLLDAKQSQLMQVSGNPNDRFFFKGRINSDGILTFSYHLKNKIGEVSDSIDPDQAFDQMMRYFADRKVEVKGIQMGWPDGDSDRVLFSTALREVAGDLKRATFKTWIGQKATAYGFTDVSLFKGDWTEFKLSDIAIDHAPGHLVFTNPKDVKKLVFSADVRLRNYAEFKARDDHYQYSLFGKNSNHQLHVTYTIENSDALPSISEAFDQMMGHFVEKQNGVTMIKSNWKNLGDEDARLFSEARKRGLSIADALKETWIGKMAMQKGYTQVKVEPRSGGYRETTERLVFPIQVQFSQPR